MEQKLVRRYIKKNYISLFHLNLVHKFAAFNLFIHIPISVNSLKNTHFVVVVFLFHSINVRGVKIYHFLMNFVLELSQVERQSVWTSQIKYLVFYSLEYGRRTILFLVPCRTLRIAVHITKFMLVKQYSSFVRQRNSVSFYANGNSMEKRTG